MPKGAFIIRVCTPEWLPPIVQGGFTMMPLPQAQGAEALYGPGAWNEGHAGGSIVAGTYDSDKKYKAAAPTASGLTAQAAKLHTQIRDRAKAASETTPRFKGDHTPIQSTGTRRPHPDLETTTRCGDHTPIQSTGTHPVGCLEEKIEYEHGKR